MKNGFFALVLGVALVLVSCGGGGNNQGVVLKMALGADITSTNPHLMEDNNSFNIGLNAFEGLFNMNTKTAQAELGLVDSYTLSDDGLTYTFILKDNLMFSDKTPITAQTVVDSWTIALDPATASPTAYMLAEILANGTAVNSGSLPLEELGVKALDDKTLEVHLAFPAPYARDVFALPVAVVIPTHIAKAKGENWNRSYPIVSSGAFIVNQWKPSSQVVLTKNPNYHGTENVHLDTIIIYTLDDMNTAYNMYLNKEIDFLAIISPDKIEEAVLRADYHSDPFVNGYYYLFNIDRKPLDDVRVRQALAKSIDRETLTEKILKGGEIPLYSVIYEMPNYPSEEYLKENVAEAKALLAQAGFPDGQGFPSLTLTYNTLEINKKVAEFVQQQWKQNLGISVNLQNQEWKTFLGTRASFDYDILRMSWLPDYPDPISMLNFFLGEAGYSNYKNAEYDNLLKRTNLMANVAERMQALARAEAKVMQDLPFIPVLSIAKNTLFDADKWDGLYNNPSNINLFRGVRLKDN